MNKDEKDELAANVYTGADQTFYFNTVESESVLKQVKGENGAFSQRHTDPLPNALEHAYKMGDVPALGDDNGEFKYDKFSLSPNTKYRFKVATVTGYGEGACSMVLSSTTLPAQKGPKYITNENGNLKAVKMNPANIPWIRDGHASVSDRGEHYGLPDLPAMRDGGDRMFQMD
jgi:hypothetical protein